MAANRTKRKGTTRPPTVAKVATGVTGLDDVLNGGVPKGRATLLSGMAGAGKTMLATEFLVRGAEAGEPGVLLSFEEPRDDLVANGASLGFDLDRLERDGLLAIDHVGTVEGGTSGDYDLEGLFLRLGAAIDRVKATRVVLDTIEALFAGAAGEAVVRAELRRLVVWLKARKVTAIVTAEAVPGAVTRHGVEEFVADCVITLEHHAEQGAATRRLQVRKYRGSPHAAYRFPFYMDDEGITVLPLATEALRAEASDQRISTGVAALDEMFGGGIFRGSTMLVSGSSGSGKTSIAASMVDAACERGEKALYISFEESPAQLARNLRSIGVRFDRWLRKGTLRMSCHRPSGIGLEHQYGEMQRLVRDERPDLVVIDPVSTFERTGDVWDQRSILLREIDFLKSNGITAVLTSMTDVSHDERSNAAISSIVDSWVYVQVLQGDSERNRGLFVLKSRGMAHSNQVREFLLTDHGIELRDVYVGDKGVLTGTARAAREAEDRADDLRKLQLVERMESDLDRRRAEVEAEVAELRRAFAAEESAALLAIEEGRAEAVERETDRAEQGRRRTEFGPGGSR